jgi:diguanylate cyclase (GGDEF)-like protein
MSTALDAARSFVNGMSDPAVVLDGDQRIVYYNPVYVAMTGMKVRTLDKTIAEGREPFRVVDMPAGLAEHRAQALSTALAVRLAEVTVESDAGVQRTVLVTMIPVIDDGLSIGLIEYMRDVTDEARVQARYQEMLQLEQARANELERQVEERTRELRFALDEVTRLSRTDPLTGLLNRRSFSEHAAQAIALAERHERSLALIIGDLDHFKKINDTFGHKVGDLVLIAAAQAITNAVRESDHVARFGGEEFVVLLAETAPQAVMDVANRILTSIRAIDLQQLSPGAQGSPSISLGVAVYPEHANSVDDLVSHADEALYHVKQSGRNRAELYVHSIMSVPQLVPKQRILAVGGEWLQSSGYRDALGDRYEVTHAPDPETASAMCRQQAFDIILAAQKDGREVGREAMTATLTDAPAALHVLIIDDEALFHGERGAGAAQIDAYLLHRDVKGHLVAAVEDALTRKDVTREMLLHGGASLPSAYAMHVEHLQKLISERALRFAYQTIVTAKDRKPFAEEALCRADDPLFRNPAVLFDAAVQRGSLWQLGRLVRSIAPLPLATLPPEMVIFVNLHPAEIADPELYSSLDPKLASRIVFELTERGAIDDFDRFREQVDALRAHGYRVALDDLGAGYASLNAVALLEPDFVKIDMTIIRGIEESLARSRLVKRIVEFANDQGILVVAEGVETAAEADCVEELGCHLMQGYFFGKPRSLT